MEHAVHVTGVEKRHDVGMVELRRDLDLLEEPTDRNRRGQLRPQHLDGNAPIVLHVLGQIDGCHPASPKLTDRVIVAPQRLAQQL